MEPGARRAGGGLDRTRLVLLVLLAALLGVGMWAYRGVGDSLREIRATGMQALLNTQVGTLEQWISERLHEAEQLAADPELSAGIGRLAAGGGDGTPIIAGILRKAAPIGVTGARVIDPRGRILAARDVQRIGSEVTPDFFAHLSPVLAGHPAFVRPYRGAGAEEIGRAWVAVPISRLKAAAMADFVVCFYNPVSQRRRDQLPRARDILLTGRGPDTPVILARQLGRPGETVEVIRLADLDADKVDMLTMVVVGSSETRTFTAGQHAWTYTPRGYGKKMV